MKQTNDIKRTKATANTFKRCRDVLQQQRRPTAKYGNSEYDELRRTNHENIKNIWKANESITRYQFQQSRML